MRQLILLVTVAIFFLPVLLCAQQPGFAWFEQATGKHGDVRITHVLTDRSGCTIVKATFQGSIVLGDTCYESSDYITSDYIYCDLLYRLNPDGNVVWVQPYYLPYTSFRYITVDPSGNIYLSYFFYDNMVVWGHELVESQGDSNFFVAKLNRDGDCPWIRQVIGGSTPYFSMATDVNLNCYILGHFYNHITLGDMSFVTDSDFDAFLCKISPSGEFLWSRHIPVEDGGTLVPLAVDISGNCFVTGRLYGSITFDDTTISIPISTTSSAFYARYNSQGTCTLVGALYDGGMNHAQHLPEHIVGDGAGGFYLTYKYYYREVHNFVQKLRVMRCNSNGQTQQLYSSPVQWITTKMLTKDQSGNLVIAGDYEGQITLGSFTLNKSSGFYVGKMSPTGTWLSAEDPYGDGNVPQITYFNLLLDDSMLFTWSASDSLTIGSYQSHDTQPYKTLNMVSLNNLHQVTWAHSTEPFYNRSTSVDLVKGTSNLYTCGNFSGDTMVGSSVLRQRGNGDIYVASMNIWTEWLWAASAGGPGVDEAKALAVDAEGCSYVVGSFSKTAWFGDFQVGGGRDTNIFVAKLDPQGNWLWVRTAGGPGFDRANDIVLDAEGNLYVTGSFSSQAQFGDAWVESRGGEDIFVATLDPEGNWLNIGTGGESGHDRGNSIAILSSGAVIVGGDFSANTQTGDIQLNSGGAQEAFAALLTEEFNWLWMRFMGGTEDDSCVDLGLDGQDNIYLTGTYLGEANCGDINLRQRGNTDIFTASLSPSGDWLWASSAGGTEADSVRCLVVDAAGNLTITGTFTGTVDFGSFNRSSVSLYDIFTASQSSTGNWLWLKATGGPYNDAGNALALSQDGDLYISGSFEADYNHKFYSAYEVFYPNGKSDSFIGCMREGVYIEPEEATPAVTEIRAAYPNPFSDQVQIDIERDSEELVVVDVFNIRGQLVRRLLNTVLDRGLHQISWDGRDSNGSACANGVYLVRLQTSNTSFSRKLLLKRN